MKKYFLYVLLPIAFIASYQDIIWHIIQSWTTPQGSHGILIFAVSIYLVWIKRKELRQFQADPSLLPGGLLLAAGCFVFFAGEISSTLLVEMLSMIPVLLGIILLFGGIHHFKILWLPVCYLVFLTGFVEHLFGSFVINIQQFTAWLSAVSLRIIGFPVFLDSTIIVLPHISLEVVRACSGISHIVALLALAVPLAHLAQKTLFRKAILVVSALFIGLLANGLRIVLIGIYTRFYPDVPIHGPHETLRVTVIFFFGLIVLLLLSNILSPKEPKRRHEAKDPTDTYDSSLCDSGDGKSSFARCAESGVFTRKQVYSFVIGAGIFLVTLWLLNFQIPKAVEIESSLENFPNHIAGFTGMDIDYVDDRIRPFAADEELLRRYENENGKSAELYIGYLEIQDSDRKIAGYQQAWMHHDYSRIRISDEGKTFVINRTMLRNGTNTSNIYFFYIIDGRIVRSQYTGKILTFMSGFFKRKTNGAVIVISSRSGPEEIQPLILEMGHAVKMHFGF